MSSRVNEPESRQRRYVAVIVRLYPFQFVMSDVRFSSLARQSNPVYIIYIIRLLKRITFEAQRA